MIAGSKEHLDWLHKDAPRDDACQFENWVAAYVMCDWNTPMAFSMREAGLE